MSNKPIFPRTAPPSPAEKPKRPKLQKGQPVHAESRAGFEVDGFFDGAERFDTNGKTITIFWIKDPAGDRWKFMPWEVNPREAA